MVSNGPSSSGARPGFSPKPQMRGILENVGGPSTHIGALAAFVNLVNLDSLDRVSQYGIE